jgi:hypothetical protein
MNRRAVRRITLWLIVGSVILGCVTPAVVTSPSDSGSVPVETIVFQTAAAAQTQTAVVMPDTATPTLVPSPSKTLTITPTPTATVLFLLFPPTNTSVPTGLFVDDGDDGDGSGSGSGGDDNDPDGFVKPTATPSEWACRVLSKSPARGAIVTAGTDFTAVWTVQNTGTKTWPKKGVDVVYESGARLNHGKPYYDIPAGVAPGGTVRISVTMEVPKRPKDYNMRWSLKVGRTNFCSVQFVFSAR